MLKERSAQFIPLKTSTPNEVCKRRQRSLWGLAKRFINSNKNRDSEATTSLIQASAVTTVAEPLPSSSNDVTPEKKQQLNGPVLLSVFEHLPLLDRIRLRMACKLTNFLYRSVPVTLPPLKLETVNPEEIYCFSENLDFIVNCLIPEAEVEINYEERCIAIKNWQAQLLMQRIAQRTDKIEHLWLESSLNGLLCSTLRQEVEDDCGRKCYRRRNLQLEKLTVIGNKATAIAEVSNFVAKFSASLEQLRLRHMRMDSDEMSQEFWKSVGKCVRLRQFQYETCRYDRFSHLYIANALRNKEITTLELSGIHELTAGNLSQLTRSRPMKNLSVLCPQIEISSYLVAGIVESIQHVDSLLFRCGASFAIDDFGERQAVESVLKKMKEKARLEVLHDVNNRVAHAARTISYWLQLSKETDRTIMLKLADISQEKIDQAIGRVFRKCDSVFKAASNCTALVLTRGNGRVHLLDNHTWFGEDEEDS